MSAERVITPEEQEVVGRLSADWRQTIEELGGNIDKSQEVFERIVKEYSTGDGRAYHNIFHIDRMLSVVKRFGHLCDNLSLVKAAVFGHDIVYNPGSDQNERESSDMFSKILEELEVEEDKIEVVDRLIMVTEKHKTTEDDRDGRLIVDADFDILGANSEVYRKYSRGIHAEYVLTGRVSLEDFKKGRVQTYLNLWLSDIEENRLYLNPEIGEVLNNQAKQNILEEKEWLASL